jgi:hypothetical protein
VGTYPGDRLTTFSAGGRQRWGAGGEIGLSTSLTLWDDMQSDMLLANGLIETRTAGQARIVGLTLAARRALGRGWALEGGGTVQSARLVRNALGIALEDTRLPAIPDYSWRLAAERRWPWGAAKAHLRLALNGTGPSRLSFQPGIDRRMGDVLDSRIEAGLDWPRHRVLLAISNPLARSGRSVCLWHAAACRAGAVHAAKTGHLQPFLQPRFLIAPCRRHSVHREWIDRPKVLF